MENGGGCVLEMPAQAPAELRLRAGVLALGAGELKATATTAVFTCTSALTAEAGTLRHRVGAFQVL